MATIPYSRSYRTSYENFTAQCPSCGQESIFNRATDLKDLSPIAFRTVSCLNADCRKPFNINGDSINSPHEMLIFDCYELLEQKHYMNCILTLTQAYELFFSLFLRVQLLYKPFAQDTGIDIEEFNRLARRLAEKLRRHTFDRMRSLFLGHLISNVWPESLAQAEGAIAALQDAPKPPSNAELERVEDEQLRFLLKAMRGTRINIRRNEVVHKHAHRPTRDEAEAALEETRSILFPLTQRLSLHDDINWYVQLERRRIR